MSDISELDFFTDKSLLENPYPYFDAHREQAPINKMKGRDVYIVTGFQECVEILRDTENFSSVIATSGPLIDLPFKVEGDDISAELEAHREEIEAHDMATSLDGEAHKNARAILNRLFTPTRLKANEEYMVEVADRMASEVIAKGSCDIVNDIAKPFVTLIVSDLLGVPAEDRERFIAAINSATPPFHMDSEGGALPADDSYMQMGMDFMAYVEDRQANPRDDIITEMTNATYPDGSKPDAVELVKLMMFVFGAGQDTSAKLLSNAVRFLAENKEVQQQLREDPSLMRHFLEENLRLEGITKITARLATKTTKVGDTTIPAGTKLLIALAGANRDPKRWDDPNKFQLKRPKIMEHLSFSRGAHTCIGAPLARTEVRVFLNTFLEKTSDISLDEEHHGPGGKREIEYEASYALRGPTKLHVKLTPA